MGHRLPHRDGVGLYGDAVLDDSNNLWTGWIIQTLPLIAAAQFTGRRSRSATASAAPGWVGFVFIIVGATLTRVLQKQAKADETAGGPELARAPSV